MSFTLEQYGADRQRLGCGDADYHLNVPPGEYGYIGVGVTDAGRMNLELVSNDGGKIQVPAGAKWVLRPKTDEQKQAQPQVPTIGRIVEYRLTDADVKGICGVTSRPEANAPGCWCWPARV